MNCKHSLLSKINKNKALINKLLQFSSIEIHNQCKRHIVCWETILNFNMEAWTFRSVAYMPIRMHVPVYKHVYETWTLYNSRLSNSPIGGPHLVRHRPPWSPCSTAAAPVMVNKTVTKNLNSHNIFSAMILSISISITLKILLITHIEKLLCKFIWTFSFS